MFYKPKNAVYVAFCPRCDREFESAEKKEAFEKVGAHIQLAHPGYYETHWKEDADDTPERTATIVKTDGTPSFGGGENPGNGNGGIVEP